MCHSASTLITLIFYESLLLSGICALLNLRLSRFTARFYEFLSPLRNKADLYKEGEDREGQCVCVTEIKIAVLRCFTLFDVTIFVLYFSLRKVCVHVCNND